MNPANVGHPISDQDQFVRFLRMAAAILIVGLSLAIAASSLKSPLLPIAFWAGLLFLVLLYRLRPTALEILFFLLAPNLVLIPAATKIAESRTGLIWIILLLIIWYFKGMRGRWTQKSVRTPYVYLLVALCIILMVSLFVTPKFSLSYTTPPQALALVFVYWMLAQSLSGENFKRLLTALFLGTVAGAVGFLIAVGGGATRATLMNAAYGFTRSFVLDYNPNFWGKYVYIGLPLAAVLLLYLYKDKRHWLWIIPGALMLFMVAFISMSRSALLAAGTSLAFLAFTHRRARKFFWVAIVGGMMVLLFLTPETLAMLSGALRLRSGLSGREDIWPLALQVISEHPFVGLGPSWFEERFFFLSPFMTNGLYSAISKPSAHNAFLTIGTDVGIFASIFALGIFFLFASRTRALWDRLKNTPNFGILVGLSALVLAGFVRALFETDTILPYRYFTINSLLIALLALQDQLYSREFSTS